jgi:hydroxyacylglutathione hydrolase
MPWIKTIPSGPFETNAFLVGADDSDEAVLIDAPPQCRDKVKAELAEAGRSLTAVLITHSHFDHILDAGLFSAEDVPLYAHRDAVDGIENPQTLGLIPTPDGGFTGGSVARQISGGETLKIAGLEFLVLEVPGHSDGSLAFHCPALSICFSGDLVFRGSVGRTDLPGGDFDVLAESIQTAIYTMNDDTVLYPGHGPSTSVGGEKRSNPYVRG